MLNAIQTHLARGARRALWASVGMVLLLTGLGFLTVALWLVLSALYEGQFAALVIGLGYVGAGLIVLGLGVKRPETDSQCPDPQRPATGPFEQVMIAFFEGVQAGKMARK
ncbi:phage holin family protein [Celeribacter sp. ULVN23_4]